MPADQGVSIADPRHELVRTERGLADRLLSERSLLVLCVVLGAIQVWIVRYAMNQDGMSYLDVGDAYFRRDWANAISGYWSPMYTWFLGLALYVMKPSMWWECITVHFVNLIIYVGALFSFRFFLHSVLRALRDNETESAVDSRPLPESLLCGLGYGIFLWASLVLIDAGDITPDLLVAAFLFLIAGYLVDLRYHESYGKFAMFGGLCGAAYLSKAAMFPIGCGMLAILLFSGRISRRRVLGVLLAGVMFAVVSLPYVAALSKQKGRLTFGDSGRLAYASMVNPNVPQKHWQGDPPEGGIPKHTTRQLLDRPPVFEFAEPVGGTYPPWYDPSYWNEGAHGTFRLRAQIRVLVQSARNYTKMLVRQMGLLAGSPYLYLLGWRADSKSDPCQLAADRRRRPRPWRILGGSGEVAIYWRLLRVVVRCDSGRYSATKEYAECAPDKICGGGSDGNYLVFGCSAFGGNGLHGQYRLC